MGFAYLNDDLNIVQNLSDRPSETEPNGLSPQEFKAKFDEAANIIQKYINERLITSITASNVPFASNKGVEGSTVVGALEWVYEQLKNASAGKIVEGSIEKEMLASDVQAMIARSAPIVSAEAPTEANNNLVGQVWVQTENGEQSGKLVGMYIQVAPTGVEWKRYVFDVLPVTKGGTGKETFGVGKLLYGNGTELAELNIPTDEEHYLTFENGKPAWRETSRIGDIITRIKTAHGEYTGDGAKTRNIELGIEPVVLCIVNDTVKSDNATITSNDHIHILTQGQTIKRYKTGSTNEWESMTLLGNTLKIESNNTNATNYANYNKDLYRWTAIY